MQGSLLQGRYKILQPLGQGGFGQTHLAADTQRPKHPQCAVKLLQVQPPAPGVPVSASLLAFAKQRFEQEAEILERLGKHDRIPQLLAYFEENQQFYLVQEFIEGNPLSQEIIPGKKLGETEVIAFLQDTLEVLAFVHREKTIHRDIKPANLMRRQADGKIVLIDFGAVKEIRGLSANPNSPSLTVAIGTHGYMPDEQANGKPQLSSDVYAVGIIAIQALTGLNPNPKAGGLPQDSSTGEISWRHLATVRDDLANIIDKMVKKDYRQRYAGAGEALEAILAANPAAQPTAISSPPSSGNNSTLKPNQSTPKPNQSTLKPNQSALTSILNWPRNHKLALAGLVVGVLGLILTVLQLLLGIFGVRDATYKNNGVILKYPGDWEAQQVTPPVGGDRAVFQSPKQDSSDPYQENITLAIIDLAQPLTPQEYYEQQLRPKLESNYDIPLMSTANTATLDNREARTIAYSTRENGIELKRQVIWTVKNGKVYQLTYSGEVANFPIDREKVMKKVQESFKIP